MTILTFYYNSLFSDCSLQLKLNNTTIEIPIHKVIMSASSKYIFEFCKTNMDCKKIEIPQIDEKCEDNEKVNYKECIDLVIKFCYSNQNFNIIQDDININNVWVILKFACWLQIENLMKNIDSILTIKLFEDVLNQSKIELLNKASEYNLEELKKKLTKTIIQDYSDGKEINEDDIYNLDPETFKNVMSSDELKVESEKKVGDIVINYIKKRKNAINEKQEKILVLCIRFSFLTHNELIEYKSDEIIGKYSELLFEALSAKLNNYELSKDINFQINTNQRKNYVEPKEISQTEKMENINKISPKLTFKKCGIEPPISDNIHKIDQFDISVNINNVRLSNLPKKQVLTYESENDLKGVFFFIGTKGYTCTYINPSLINEVSVYASSIGNGNACDLVGRNVINLRTKNEPNSYFVIDLGKSRYLCPTSYSIRNRNSSTQVMVNWVLEGSNDMIDFEVIDQRNFGVQGAYKYNVEKIREKLSLPGNISNWKIAQDIKDKYSLGFKYFRIRQIGKNLSGSNILSLSGLELYGDCFGEGWNINN